MDADSQHIFSYDLAHFIRTEVHGGAKEILRKCKHCLQLSHFGQQIAFSEPTSAGAALKKGNLLSDDDTLLVEGGWADYQFPKWSPNGGYIAFEHRRGSDKESIEVLANRSGAKPQAIYECDVPTEYSRCDLATWIDEEAVIVVDKNLANKVTLSGDVTTLASNIESVVSGN